MGTKQVFTKKVKGKTRNESAAFISKQGSRAAVTKNISGSPAPIPDEYDDYEFPLRKRAKPEVRVEDGKLIITLPYFDTPTRSTSGKSFVVATSGGVKRTSFFVNDEPVHVVATAFFYDNSGPPPVQWEPLFELQKSNPYKDPHDEDNDEEEDAKEFEAVKDLAEDDY